MFASFLTNLLQFYSNVNSQFYSGSMTVFNIDLSVDSSYYIRNKPFFVFQIILMCHH